jgi:ribosomal protein L11 methyltransferase
LPAPEAARLKRYVVVGGEPELALLLHLFPRGVEELDGAYAVYADEPPVGFDIVEVDDVAQGWEEAWREFHHGIVVGRLWVGPPWEEPSPDAEPVVIDPGRAFGTGAHATTRLCLELLQTFEPRSLLDVGCGSGVLGIAAAKLGFAPVIAVDAEPEAVGIALANAAANDVEVEVRRADALAAELPLTDIVVANIALEPVERLLARLDARLAVVSGYLERDAPRAAGWRRIERRDREGWAADVFERR